MSINRQLIWSPILQQWQLVELIRQKKHQQRKSIQQHKSIAVRCGLRLAALGVLMASGAALASQLPTGGTVSFGQGSITQPNNQQLNIKQQSGKLAIDWQQFNIGVGNKVTFQQPNSKAVALNRVVGSDGSKIMGQLRANGQVFLINPNGVLFGKGANVNVGGLVASTLELTNQQLNAGEYSFNSNQQSPASVVNQGRLQADQGGSVVLLGGVASNQGTIIADQGTIALGAGKAATLALSDSGLIQLEISEAALNARVNNDNKLRANGGQVLLTAQSQPSVLQQVVNNQGVIEARSLQQRQGKIVLSGGEHGEVIVGGTLQATGEDQGGTIVTQGAQLIVTDTAFLDTRARQGNSGWWQVKSDGLTVQERGGVSGSKLSRQLASTNIALDSGSQDLTVAAQINWNNDHTLRLSSDSNLQLNANISATGDNGRLELNHGEQGDYFLNNNKVTLSGTGSGFALNGQQYQVIHNVDQLQAINDNLKGHYVLGNTIDASVTKEWNEGQGFMPIGAASSDSDSDNIFQGVFSGLGNTIDQLTINQQAKWENGYGLFGYSQGHLRNVGLQDLQLLIKGEKIFYAGGLVGVNRGIVEHIRSVGTVTAWTNNTQSKAGGLIGFNWGTVNNSTVSGDVLGTDFVGGLIGYNSGTVNNSIVRGTVSGDKHIGGLIGLGGINGIISGSHAIVDVSGTDFVGGLIGLNINSDVNNSTASGRVSGADYVGGLIGSNYYIAGLDGNRSTVSGSYASGDVFGINLVGGLIGESLYSSVLDSAASGTVSGNENVGGLIGYSHESKFNDSFASGTVSGNENVGGLVGYSKAGTINSSSASGTVSGNENVGGLIGYTWESSVINSAAIGDVSGIEDVGGLIGYSYESKFNDSFASGTVSGNENVGGLVGQNDRGTVTGSAASGDVSGNEKVGGLVGSNNKGTVRDSTASGAVSGKDFVGGLIGYDFNLNFTGIISDSSASGDVSGVDYVGGLIGYAWGSSVINSTASGDVSGMEEVGGLIGYNNQGVINDSSAIGDVSGVENVGGLIGYSYEGKVSNSFASGTVSGNNSIGGLIGNNLGTVDRSVASGDVSGTDYVGGFIGYNLGTVDRSVASGDVSGADYVGGFIGYNYEGIVNYSVASGAVAGNYDIGGLIGSNRGGRVSNSSASGQVVGQLAGGLIGNNFYSKGHYYDDEYNVIDTLLIGVIVNSIASGKVSGINAQSITGGLVGVNCATITDSFATGDVTNTGVAGSLVGKNSRQQLLINDEVVTVTGTINSSIATGWVNNQHGLLVGENNGIINL